MLFLRLRRAQFVAVGDVVLADVVRRLVKLGPHLCTDGRVEGFFADGIDAVVVGVEEREGRACGGVDGGAGGGQDHVEAGEGGWEGGLRRGGDAAEHVGNVDEEFRRGGGGGRPFMQANGASVK